MRVGVFSWGREHRKEGIRREKTLKMFEKAITKHHFVFLKYVCVRACARYKYMYTHTNVLNEVTSLEVIMPFPSTTDFLNKTTKARHGKSLFE